MLEDICAGNVFNLSFDFDLYGANYREMT